jgi:3-isopropylmalate dehydrogenase
MMMRYSLGREDIAEKIEAAVRKALEDGARTRDIALQGEIVLSTAEMGDKVQEVLKTL